MIASIFTSIIASLFSASQGFLRASEGYHIVRLLEFLLLVS